MAVFKVTMDKQQLKENLSDKGFPYIRMAENMREIFKYVRETSK